MTQEKPKCDGPKQILAQHVKQAEQKDILTPDRTAEMTKAINDMSRQLERYSREHVDSSWRPSVLNLENLKLQHSPTSMPRRTTSMYQFNGGGITADNFSSTKRVHQPYDLSNHNLGGTNGFKANHHTSGIAGSAGDRLQVLMEELKARKVGSNAQHVDVVPPIRDGSGGTVRQQTLDDRSSVVRRSSADPLSAGSCAKTHQLNRKSDEHLDQLCSQLTMGSSRLPQIRHELVEATQRREQLNEPDADSALMHAIKGIEAVLPMMDANIKKMEVTASSVKVQIEEMKAVSTMLGAKIKDLRKTVDDKLVVSSKATATPIQELQKGLSGRQVKLCQAKEELVMIQKMLDESVASNKTAMADGSRVMHHSPFTFVASPQALSNKGNVENGKALNKLEAVKEQCEGAKQCNKLLDPAELLLANPSLYRSYAAFLSEFLELEPRKREMMMALLEKSQHAVACPSEEDKVAKDDARKL